MDNKEQEENTNNLNPESPKFKVGSIVKFNFMFPEGTKRLLFCIRKSVVSSNLIEQVIENPSLKKGMAEVLISGLGTQTLDAGKYKWYIFCLRDDGTRDCWLPFSEGNIEFIK